MAYLRWAYRISLALSLTAAFAAGSAAENVEERKPTVADFDRLAELIAAPEAVSTSQAQIAAHWRSLVVMGEPSDEHTARINCVLRSISPDRDLSEANKSWIQTIWVRLRPDPCTEPMLPVETDIKILNRGVADMPDLRSRLERRLGQPDPACSTAKLAFWRLAPGRSVEWRSTKNGWVNILVRPSDPPDASCANSSVPAEAVMTAQRAEAIVKQLADQSLDLDDAAQVAQIIEVHGKISRSLLGCDNGLAVSNPHTQWIGSIDVSFQKNKENCSEKHYPSSLTFYTGGRDGRIGSILEAALRKQIGNPDPMCGNDRAMVWRFGSQRTLTLRSDVQDGAANLKLYAKALSGLCKDWPELKGGVRL